MGLESTMVCVDNSDFMRNGDFVPTRLQAQQDAVNVVCHCKTRANPENNVGLLTLANTEVLVTLTTDVGRLLSKLHQVTPKGTIKIGTGIKIAHLALKHRQGKHHKMRIVVFIGSPVEEDEKELVKLAKKLKKEKVIVDVINFGEENAVANNDKLTAFINTLNGKDGTSCNLVTVSSGTLLSDAIVHSPVVLGEDGAGAPPAGMSGFEFGVDPNEDPELALALRVSMEEQRARQEKEARDTQAKSAMEAGVPIQETSEEAMLKQALDMSQKPEPCEPDYSNMTEDEQIAYAMQLSMQQGASNDDDTMETEESSSKDEGGEDMDEVMNDPEFLQSVLESLPGVDMDSDTIRTAVGELAKQNKEDKDKANKEKKDKK